MFLYVGALRASSEKNLSLCLFNVLSESLCRDLAARLSLYDMSERG
jgi:hypothetical protein